MKALKGWDQFIYSSSFSLHHIVIIHDYMMRVVSWAFGCVLL